MRNRKLTDVPETSTIAPPDLQRCILFHGHFCPGLAIGFRAAAEALERLAADRAEDEELVAIVENDSCAVDAVQVLTGCTFGKGNLVFRDHGKHVYTFALRSGGRSLRMSLRPADDRPGDGDLTRAERIDLLLTAPTDELFDIVELDAPLPPMARIHESVRCDACGEPVMTTRTRTVGGRTLCIPCATAATRRDATLTQQ